MLRKITLVLFVFCFLPKVVAADKIEEGFGLRLGDVFEPATALSTNAPIEPADMPREVEYGVAVTKSIHPFDTLFLQITPQTHKIYRIIARGEKLSAEQKKQVKQDLQHKFPGAQRSTRRISVRAIMTGGNPGIDGKTVARKVTTEAVYTALDLQDIALKERASSK